MLRPAIPVSVSDGLRRRLAAPVEASLYFFLYEALTNAVKHASANRVRVALSVAGDRLTVEVSDDGVGGARATAGGTGLAGLGDRIAALDGELRISSPPGEGTTLHAVVPLGRDQTPRTSKQAGAVTPRARHR